MIVPAPNLSSSDSVEPVLKRLLHAGENLPDDARDRILGLGRAVAAPTLVKIMETDALAETDAPGDGYAPIHAVALLEALRANEAIEPMLRVLARCDALDILYTRLVFALQSLGAPVLEPALAAHAAAETEEQRIALEDVLAGLGVRDGRILRILIGSLGRTIQHGAMLLAKYGDEAALPALGAVLDACEFDRQGGFLANGDLIELDAAIQDLGGRFTPDQERKLERLRAAQRTATASLRQVGAPDDDDNWAGDEDLARDLDDGPDDAEERGRILDRFEASPHAADAPSRGWIGLALEYAAEHLDTPFADLDGDALDEIVFEVFPRKVSCEPDAAPEAVRSLRAFWTFARDVLAHPHAEDCLQVLGEGAAERLERALADPSNFGLAKSFVMSGGVPPLSGRSGGSSCRPPGSRAQRKQKKRVRK